MYKFSTTIKLLSNKPEEIESRQQEQFSNRELSKIYFLNKILWRLKLWKKMRFCNFKMMTIFAT
jgi:hypothetical protein